MLSRRTFLVGSAGALLIPWRSAVAAALPAATLGNLESSTFVYLSPLQSNGSESRCHGEVWYGWLEGSVVIITAASTWKARSQALGRDRARIWVGNHGRWKGLVGRNEDFRKAPSFDTRAAIVTDDALLDRLLALYETKYPDEIARWRDRMREGYADGSRVLIRYHPV